MKKRTPGKLLRAALLAAATVMALFALMLQLPPADCDASTAEGRLRFLSGLGWEIDAASEERRSVLIPDCGEGVMAEYNALQRRQGYDLSPWTGREVTQYCYTVTNYPGYGQTVYAVLYVSGRRVIGGDVHSAALNGFMHGLRRGEAA